MGDLKDGTSGKLQRRPSSARLASSVLALLIAAISLTAALASTAAPASAVVEEAPVAELVVAGSVQNAPPNAGATTASEIRYRVTVTNRGPDPVPASSIRFTISVLINGGPDRSTIEVSRFNAPFIPLGGACGVGRQTVLSCTNSQQLAVGQDLVLVLEHRHPATAAGTHAFSFQAAPVGQSYTEGNTANNGFGGPTYVFANPPTTTTTTIAPTTTLPPTTVPETTAAETTLPETTLAETTVPESSTTEAESTTSSTEESTTTLESTTTTEATTTSEAPTTLAPTTTVPTTLAPDTSVDALAGSEAALPDQDQGSGSVLGATGEAENAVAEGSSQELVVAQAAEDDDGGFPVLLLVGVFAVLLLLAGVGLALFAHYNRPPPLVDIRQFD